MFDRDVQLVLRVQGNIRELLHLLGQIVQKSQLAHPLSSLSVAFLNYTLGWSRERDYTCYTGHCGPSRSLGPGASLCRMQRQADYTTVIQGSPIDRAYV